MQKEKKRQDIDHHACVISNKATVQKRKYSSEYL